jgi:hypothetical protein
MSLGPTLVGQAEFRTRTIVPTHEGMMERSVLSKVTCRGKCCNLKATKIRSLYSYDYTSIYCENNILLCEQFHIMPAQLNTSGQVGPAIFGSSSSELDNVHFLPRQELCPHICAYDY